MLPPSKLSAQIDFDARRDFLAADNGPGDVFLSDFDGDGTPDVVCLEDALIGFYKGNGDGTIQAPTTIPSIEGTHRGVMRDIDGDQIPDIVALSRSAAVEKLLFFRGLASPSLFAAPIEVVIESGVGRRPFIADFNNDMCLDVAIAYHATDEIQIFLGDGAGNFAHAANQSSATCPIAMATADFNRDGNADLAVATTSPRQIAVFHGQGNLTFQLAATFPEPFLPTILVAGDVDRDGWEDLISTLAADPIRIHFNDRAGGFASPVSVTSNSFDDRELYMADLNGDLWGDFVVLTDQPGAGNASVVSVVVSDGVGGYTSPRIEPGVDRGESVAFGDLNNDTKLDVVISGRGGTDISVHLGDGNGGLGPFAVSIPFDYFSSKNSESCDWTGDGRPDVMVAGRDGADYDLWLYKGQPDGQLVPETLIEVMGDINDLTAGDFDLDGEKDIAIARQTWSLYFGDGAGGFTPGPEVLNGGEAEAIASGDFNGDGFLDIVVTVPSTSEIKVYLADGGGGFLAPTVLSGFPANAVRVGDVDSDGNLDIGTTWFSTRVFFGDGTGAFPTSVAVPLQLTSPRSITLRDFDGDALLDVGIVGDDPSDADFGAFSVAKNSSGRSFAFVEVQRLPSTQVVIESFDADGDGVVDVACGSQSSNNIRVLRGIGDGSFDEPAFSFGTGGGTQSKRIAVGDFSGTGRPDMLLVTSSSKDLSLVRNVSPQYPEPTVSCLQGRVNAGQGTLGDVLFVNGSAGDPSTRSLTMGPGDKFVIAMAAPPSRVMRPASSFALFAWARIANDNQLVSLPFDAGCLAFNIPATGTNRLPKRTWNNFGHIPALGVPDFASSPAPTEVLNLCDGVGLKISFTLQGIIRDDGSAAAFPASPTNGLVIHVE